MYCRHWMTSLALWTMLSVVAAAQPQYKALIVDGQNGHDWKSTSPVLKQLLEETHLFTVDVATSPPKGQDMSGFKPDFAAYDVVVSNYQGDEWPEATKKAFVKYVEGGGGVVIFHFACAAFPAWKQYNEIIGLGGWGGRNQEWGPYVRWREGKAVRDSAPESKRTGGHGPAQPFQLVVREPNHPNTKDLPAQFMHVEDELYGRLRGPAKNLTVPAAAFAPKDRGGSGEHEPLLFTVAYGNGRVLRNALGHAPQQMKCVAVLVESRDPLYRAGHRAVPVH